MTRPKNERDDPKSDNLRECTNALAIIINAIKLSFIEGHHYEI